MQRVPLHAGGGDAAKAGVAHLLRGAGDVARVRAAGVGRYKLNAVDPRRLKAPGFNP
jgi:hypothetical protein